MFLEFWKRRQAEIAYEWDLLGYEDEEVGIHKPCNTPLFVVFGGATDNSWRPTTSPSLVS